MDELKILPTKNTPEVYLNPGGFIRIAGRTLVADTPDFIKTLENWIDNYLINPADKTCIDFRFDYLPTHNIRLYISLIKRIEPVKLKNKQLIINWFYEEGDEDIFEKGGFISSTLNTPINFIKITNKNIRD